MRGSSLGWLVPLQDQCLSLDILNAVFGCGCGATILSYDFKEASGI